MSNANTEYRLKCENQTAVVSPYGASLRQYSIDLDDGRWHAVWPYGSASDGNFDGNSDGAPETATKKRGGQGDVLIPFPGRIKGGTYTYAGQTHQFAKNDKDGPNAIHGFLRAQLFSTQRVSDTEVVFKHELKATDGYPFTLDIEIQYRLGRAGLTTLFQITNKGESSAPVGAGFHPYFCGPCGRLADWDVTIHAKTFVELKSLLPTGRLLPVESTSLDFQQPRTIGSTIYNDCVTEIAHDPDDANRWSTAWLTSKASPRRISIRMDPSFQFVVVYTGDQIQAPDNRQAIAIEPMTCGPDAFNHPSLGLRILKPNETFEGQYTIKAHG